MNPMYEYTPSVDVKATGLAWGETPDIYRHRFLPLTLKRISHPKTTLNIQEGLLPEKIRSSSLTLEQILPILIDRSRKGLRVVRLHDGDPCLYGAISEQICGLIDAGIDFEVVPGVSAPRRACGNVGGVTNPKRPIYQTN